MEQYFRIGEMARLFGMNIRTLRYYDQAGLLHPVRVDPDTNYRYYSVEQFEQLNTIRYLRAQDVSLEDIRAILARRDPERMETVLRKQQEAVARRIRELENVQARLSARVEQIRDAMDPDRLGTLRLEELPARSIAALDRTLRPGEDLELPLRSLESGSGMAPSYFLGKVGLSVAREDLLKGRFDRYSRLFCLLEPGEAEEPGAELPGGLWALWRFRGTHSGAGAQYALLLKKLGEAGLAPAGDGAEFALVDYGLTRDPGQFVTELQILVTHII